MSGRGVEIKRWDDERDLLGRRYQTFAMCGTGSDSKAAEASVSVCCTRVMTASGRMTDLGKATKNVATDAYW